MREGVEGCELAAARRRRSARARIREKIQELAQRYNLDHALDRHRTRLDELLELEEQALDGARRVRGIADAARASSRACLRPFARRSTGSATTTSATTTPARTSSTSARSDRTSIASRASSSGTGACSAATESLDFEGALDLIDRMERLRAIEEALFKRDFEGIDLAGAEELLGARRHARDLEPARRARHARGGRARHAARRQAGADAEGRAPARPARARRDPPRAPLRCARASRRDRARGRWSSTARARDATRYGDPFHLATAATVANAVRRGGGLPLKLAARGPRGPRVHARHAQRDRAAARHELVDELGRALRRGEEGRARDAHAHAIALSARLLRGGRLLHARRRARRRPICPR